MSLIGWKEHITNQGQGKFFCPQCRRDAKYDLIEMRNWFNVFFVPVFPESRPIRLVHCQRCQAKFTENVLNTVVSAGLAQSDSNDAGPGKWAAGARVLAVWPVEQVFWYPATVRHSTSKWVEVDYDDGHKARVKANEVKALDILPQSRVFARIKGGPVYSPATVIEVNGDKLRIAYEDGGTETTSIAFIRILHGPGADIDWQYGDRVLAPWDPPFYYPGTVTSSNDDIARIEFDDGDQIEILIALLRPLDLKEGDPVYCRWKSGPGYFPGRIEEMADEEIFVKYEDGRAERTTIRNVRIVPDELPR